MSGQIPFPKRKASGDDVSSGGDSDDGGAKGGRRKINIEFIEDKSRRHITFSKRKAGIMKKAYELSTLTGTQVLLLVASETGHVYTFATPKLQPLITKPEGKNLIQSCLNSPDAGAPTLPPGKQSDQHAESAQYYESDRKGSARNKGAEKAAPPAAPQSLAGAGADMSLPQGYGAVASGMGMYNAPGAAMQMNARYGAPQPQYAQAYGAYPGVQGVNMPPGAMAPGPYSWGGQKMA
eukprot:TRINITY_DN80_c0_g3_i3.p1 TRINITY_DN80_c0_g3~~TRINITY_DN80_c0_g3_i3.p1  ORF type:complete len:236 (-),score=29.67 TRINITY_DN80_c0_g3_i3:697-1404(-)